MPGQVDDLGERPQALQRRESGSLLKRLLSCGSAELLPMHSPPSASPLQSSQSADPAVVKELEEAAADCNNISPVPSVNDSSLSSARSGYLTDRDPAVDNRLFQLVESVAVVRANQKYQEMQQALQQAAEEASRTGYRTRSPVWWRPTYKLKVEQIQQDSETMADVIAAAVKEEAQVLLKDMAREVGHKSLAGVEVVALTCCPKTSTLQVLRRAWCSSVGRGFFYE
eukprot:jgi/Botrbrau1/10332/Bobra.0321s0010.1